MTRVQLLFVIKQIEIVILSNWDLKIETINKFIIFFWVLCYGITEKYMLVRTFFTTFKW